MMRMRRVAPRPGVALLEVLIAVTLIAVVGVAGVTLAHQAMRTLDGAMARETELQAASAVLTTLVTLPTHELLDRHGESREGSFRVLVTSHEPALIRIAVLHGASRTPLLATTVHRPAGVPDANP